MYAVLNESKMGVVVIAKQKKNELIHLAKTNKKKK